jgi:hypothetical protein
MSTVIVGQSMKFTTSSCSHGVSLDATAVVSTHHTTPRTVSVTPLVPFCPPAVQAR